MIFSAVPRGTSAISVYLAAYVDRTSSVVVAYRVPVTLGSFGGAGWLTRALARYFAVTQRTALR